MRSLIKKVPHLPNKIVAKIAAKRKSLDVQQAILAHCKPICQERKHGMAIE
jgi:hypothetical protein